MVSSIDNIRDKAIEAFAREEYTTATDLFEQLTGQHPEDLSLKLWLASSQQWAGRLDDARNTYESVLATTQDPALVTAAQNGLAQLGGFTPPAADNGASMSGGEKSGGSRISGHRASETDAMDDAFGEFTTEFTDVGNDASMPDLFSDGDTFDSDSAEIEEELTHVAPSSAREEVDDSANPFDDLFDGADGEVLQLDAELNEETNFFVPGSAANDDTDNQTNGFAPTGELTDDDDSFALLQELDEELGLDEESSTQMAAAGDYNFAAEPFSDITGFPSEVSASDTEVLDSTEDKHDLADTSLSSSTALFEEDRAPEIPVIEEPDLSGLEQESDGEFDSLLILPDEEAADLFDSSDDDLSNLDLLAGANASGALPHGTGNAPIARSSGTKWVLLQGAAVFLVAGAGFFGTNAMNLGGAASGAIGTVAGAAAGAGTGLLAARDASRRDRRNLQALVGDIDAIARGNYTVRARLSSDGSDPFSQAFNRMAQSIENNISELERRATEQGQAKEDLQRQVIRLLDDVEGAARGDLTVRAEVTADVLGAVADSFNLTITSLREIVGQVKQAATAVSDAAQGNEALSRSLSNDALQQAEEISILLNSVQEMTQSIQDVASNATEAEAVAKQASETAVRGGVAVDRTASGILAIRETVADTTRQVKRLAESSQEISKIVAFISQIASRTNLLALNASIEAARAGESGRGFAIVADEVRQLADRSSKASKEIEQIVMQIQSETSQVMTAMEEGTQQVIEGTKLAEQAKSSLDEIIQVSQKIDGFVRSITASTVQQTETSRTVAQVMQNAELTSNETSQEAQKVSGSLIELVAIARNLQASVGKFRISEE
ncbi:methyl-accepting chemotaxis protein [Synechococcus sp. PCC 7336]|uniref:methyl-accepting chemotaxis protein n=1 Tax=Synechococcus sp. PCC 7336 TaxID=195250 RepID=UPI000348FE23|nr:methyl-accepting chemotaxis protein [Synechococcus sp. PCC 7336]